MIITDINPQKNKSRLNLFVDGEFYSGINKETAASYNFFVGKNVEENELKQIILESDSKQAFFKASDYLGVRMHTAGELKTKLLKKGYSKDAIILAIAKLKDYGYINDYEFAKNFIEQNSNLSKLVIKNKLLQKSVDKQIINDLLSIIDDQSEIESATSLAFKYLKNKNTPNLYAKTYAYLSRKGFNSNIIKQAIKNVNLADLDAEDEEW